MKTLTPTEQLILHWVEQGRHDAEISDMLVRSSCTVEAHVAAILAKLGVETRGAAGSALRYYKAFSRGRAAQG